MSATTHGSLKVEIETAYAPAEDDSFATTSVTAANTGYTSCYITVPPC